MEESEGGDAREVMKRGEEKARPARQLALG